MKNKVKIWTILLNDGCISNGYRVLNKSRSPEMKLSQRAFTHMKDVLRKKGIVYVLNKKAVRQQHGNSLIKKLYKQHYNGIRNTQPGQGI